MASTKAAEGTDEWWLDYLMGRMVAKPVKQNKKVADTRRYDYTRAEWLELLWSYHIGQPPLEKLAEEWAAATQEFLRTSKTGYAGLIASALLERITLVGARVVGEAPDVDGNDDVRRLLGVSAAAIADAFEYAAAMGEGYLLVGHGGPTGALISAEDPRSMIVDTDPVTGDVRAALKLYADDMREQLVAALYVLEDNGGARQVTYVKDGLAPVSGYVEGDWSRAESDREAQLVPGTGVPVVVVTNRGGRGEAEPHLDLLDRIYTGIANRLWAVRYQVFMQRALKGDLPEVDAEGNPVDYDDVFTADPGALWALPDGVDVWESRQMNVQEVLLPVRDDVRELAAVSKTPLPTMMAESQNGSAEGATLAREGLSFKAEDRIARWSPAMVRLVRLGLAYAGKDVPEELEPMWAPVERLSLSQRITAGRDAVQAGVPLAGVWADIMQMPPATVKRWGELKDEEVLTQSLAGLTDG